MTDNEILNYIDNYDVVVIFGNCDVGQYLYSLVNKSCNGKTVLICDTSRKKQIVINGTKVISTQEAAEKYCKGCFLLSSALHSGDMREQLIKLGINGGRIIYAVTEEAMQFTDRTNKAAQHIPLKKLRIEVNLVEHCNLNCKCCSQFSCISTPEYIDVDLMEKDFFRLGELFNGTAERIYLIGGEPLLHPKIVKCMEIARKNFQVGEISVFTNGLLLSKCKDDFWEKCRELHISIIVTRYPIELNYEDIRTMVTSKGINFSFFGNSEDFKMMNNLGLDPEGKQNAEESFTRCFESNNCIKLRNGRLYTCSRPVEIYKFNNYFNMNFEVTSKDSIDIYEAKSGEEILKKMAATIPFCKYCKKTEFARKAQIWGITNKDINEWL